MSEITEYQNRYRPASWEDVLGHKSTVLSLKSVLRKQRSRSFLFIGPSGVGKTTLARLIAGEVGCTTDGIMEISGSTHTGIDNMRELSEQIQFSTLDGSPRCVIIDEAHGLSRQAWHSILKILEEPPAKVFWILCTTEGDKIPKQIRTRCSTYELKKVPDEPILELLQQVKKQEQLNIPDEALDLITEVSDGSPRQALVYLAKCGDFKKLSSVRSVLDYGVESAEAIELCRALLAGSDWPKIAGIVRKLEVPPETARLIVLGYMGKVATAVNGKSNEALRIMSEFQQPYLDREKAAPLILSCARCVFEES